MKIVNTQLVSPDAVYTKTKDESVNIFSGKLINARRLFVLAYIKKCVTVIDF